MKLADPVLVFVGTVLCMVSSAAVIRVVTQRFSPTNFVEEKRCVTTLKTAAEETILCTKEDQSRRGLRFI